MGSSGDRRRHACIVERKKERELIVSIGMASSKVATLVPSGGPTSTSTSTMALKQPKGAVVNPLLLTDDQILEIVYITHIHTAERFDVDSLFNLTSTIITRSNASADTLLSKSGTPVVAPIQETAPSPTFNPPYRKLKQIVSEMMNTAHGEPNAHRTTMWILEELKSYTWDGKAVMTLAAFSLEYGNLLHLAGVPSGDQLGRSLAVMNNVHSIERKVVPEYVILVKNIMVAVECITELERLFSKGYDSKDVPALSNALQEIPVFVYWTIITLVSCANHIDLLVAADSELVDMYEISSFSHKLSSILSKLKAHLTKIRKEIGEVEDYWRRKRVFQTPTEIVEVLKVLIYQNETRDPQVYDGFKRQMVSIEVFRQKHVLLFISGLDSIRDEIRLLQSIYFGLQQQEPREVKGYRKEDFKILWVPVVDNWGPLQMAEFENLKLDMPWYVVDYYPLAGIKLIREDLNYRNKPMIPVLNPQGKVINPNAMHMIFVWEMDAFPFRPFDDEHLTQKWNWFWAEMRKISPRLQDMLKGDSFIFIFGGMDNEWVQSFTETLEQIKRHETIKRADAVIEYYQVGKEEPTRIVPRFWTGIESLFASTMQKKQKQTDPTIDEIKSLLCLKEEQPGWALLSKGTNVKLLGAGEPMLATAAEFERWKDQVLKKTGFDVAFRDYYETKLADYSQTDHCARFQLANYPPDIHDPINCPRPFCGRTMEIASVTYKCCHGHNHKPAADLPDTSGDVTVEKRYTS